MTQFLAKKTADFLSKDCEAADVEVLTYGYYLLYQEWLVRIFALLVALPFGLFFHVLTAIVAFTLVRRCALGAHARYPIVCRITTYTIWFGPAVLAGIFSLSFSWIAYIGLYIVGFVLLMMYAPAETDVKKVPDPQQRKRLKIEAIASMTVLFLVAVLLQGMLPAISFVIVTTVVMACCMVHPWVYWVNGFDPVTREEREW